LWRLFFLLLWILQSVIIFGRLGISREATLAIMGVAAVLTVGFFLYATRKQKALLPLINRRFAEEFTAHTGYEYPSHMDILAVKRTIPVRKDDGTVLLWGVGRSTGTIRIFHSGLQR
jgi:hypothetical protein